MIVQEPVQAAIWHCLNHYDHKDAVFLAERLCAEIETDETIFILATSYYRSNLFHQAYWLLREKSRRSAQCRFLLAKCAYKLKKYAEAECSITYAGFGDVKCFDDVVTEFGEIACFAFQLVAQICAKTERAQIAAEALRRALKLNPFMWQSYADLCHLGEKVDASSVFQINSADIFKTCQGSMNANSLIVFGGPNGSASEMSLSLNSQSAVSFIPAGTVSSTDLAVNGQLNTSCNYILSTPVDQPIQPNNNINNINNNNTTPIQNLTTPLNNGLNNTLAMLRGHNTSGICPLNVTESSPDDTTSSIAGDNGAGTPYRLKFKYLSALSPPTPSFGVLPLTSPGSPYSDTFGLGLGLGLGQGQSPANINVASANSNTSVTSTAITTVTTTTTTPSPQTLAEVNQEQKIVTKKMKSQMGGNYINRKETGIIANQGSKPAVFTQTGNITPRTPNNAANTAATGVSAPNVRRSSRLFSNNAYSVKENNKTPGITSNKFAQPRSPPRKSKSRMPKICLSNELMEDKSSSNSSSGGEKSSNEKSSRKSDKSGDSKGGDSAGDGKVKVETITSTSGSASRTPSEEQKVLLNNSLNSAQTMAHHILALKKQSAEGLMALLRDLGEAYQSLTNYQCSGIIKHLEATIPKHHLCSSWVQSLVGLAHYEMREYEAAVAVFRRIHEVDPHRLDCMEMYSSSLWHLQREVELSSLAQDLMGQDKQSPVTWCVAGNCFSLHKEHETAIKFFKRAVQVDPEFVYSYTLLGHELVLTEDLDKALDFFRAAVVRDPRHYNAWFGIATIYSKQEKYELAELHFIKALKINPQNSVILVHIGAMQYFMNKKEQALQTLNTAALLDPKNPLARFHRGSIYFSLGRHDDALRELEDLKEIVPKESVVFYLIGKIHKTLGNVDLALMHFSWATDLDPKGANNQMKDAFDTMSHPNCCPTMNEQSLDADIDPISERSDDSTQAQQDINYDSDQY